MSHRMILTLSLLILTPPVLAQSEAATQEASQEIAALQARALEIAEAYASFRWRATEKNVFHGVDEDGVPVNTPDRGFVKTGFLPDEEAVGVPYQWGGFSSLEDFEKGIGQGRWAGHIPRKRSEGASRFAVGVDCSGFVARCWKLAEKQSTRSLGKLCYQLQSWGELAPGDAINRFDAHVMLFKEWVDEERTRARVYEAVTPCVLEREHDIATLETQGYHPLRYRPFDARWYETPLTFGAPTFERPSDSPRDPVWTSDGTEGVSEGWGELDGVRRDVPPGSWVRYRLLSDEPERAALFALRGLATADATELRTRIERGDEQIESVEPREADGSLFEAWLRRVAPQGQVEDLEITRGSMRNGVCEYGGRRFPARRVEAELTLAMPSGSRKLELAVSVDGLWSPEVPLDGFVSLDLHIAVLGPDGVPVQEVDQAYRLEALRVPPPSEPGD